MSYRSDVTELTGLSEEARTLALDRFRLLRPYLEEGSPLGLIAAAAGVSLQTAQRWVRQYRRSGLAALARKRRADSTVRRSVPNRLKRAIEGLALQKPPLPIAALSRQVLQLARQHGEDSSSDWEVYRTLRERSTDPVMVAHQGAEACGDAFGWVHRCEADNSNSTWQANPTPLDIQLVRPDAGTTARSGSAA